MAGLIITHSSQKGGTVHFVHFTLKEHLLANSIFLFPTGHYMLAEATLAYLSFDAMGSKEGMQRYMKDGDLYPFFGYAAENWGHHTNQINQEDKQIM